MNPTENERPFFRLLIAMLGAILIVACLTLLAVSIYGLFDEEDYIPVIQIKTDSVLDDDYILESLACECQSSHLKTDTDNTLSGVGCHPRVLTKKQKQKLPFCQLDPMQYPNR